MVDRSSRLPASPARLWSTFALGRFFVRLRDLPIDEDPEIVDWALYSFEAYRVPADLVRLRDVEN